MKWGGAALCGLLLAVALPAAGTGSGPTVKDDWPCSGCILELPANYQPARPAALLVLLHGDEGAPGEIAGMVGPVALRRNVIVFAPQCPTELGCRLANGAGGFTNSWWGWLQYSGSYSDTWLGRQIAAVEATYRVDRRSTYLFGWSGGADYMGWYALQHSADFAAAAFVAGGVPYHPACPSTRLAGYFLLGAADPRYQTGQPLAVRSILARCGSPTKVVVLPGADHAGTMLALSTEGYAARILDWLLEHHSAPSG
jgi:pimeloyl-ACP methyl ester carboxylesterase